MNYQRNYQNTNKAVNCLQWNEAEQERLLQLQKQFGSNWNLLSASYFPNRNPNQLKCKFNYLMNRKRSPNHELLKFTSAMQESAQASQSVSAKMESLFAKPPAPVVPEQKKPESITESHSHLDEEPSEMNMLEYEMLFDLFDYE